VPGCEHIDANRSTNGQYLHGNLHTHHFNGHSRGEPALASCPLNNNRCWRKWDALPLTQLTASKHWGINGYKFLQATGYSAHHPTQQCYMRIVCNTCIENFWYCKIIYNTNNFDNKVLNKIVWWQLVFPLWNTVKTTVQKYANLIFWWHYETVVKPVLDIYKKAIAHLVTWTNLLHSLPTWFRVMLIKSLSTSYSTSACPPPFNGLALHISTTIKHT